MLVVFKIYFLKHFYLCFYVLGTYGLLLNGFITCLFRHWKFHLMGLEMLGLLLRHDVVFPAKAVQLFISNVIHENIQVRKVGSKRLLLSHLMMMMMMIHLNLKGK